MNLCSCKAFPIILYFTVSPTFFSSNELFTSGLFIHISLHVMLWAAVLDVYYPCASTLKFLP